MNYLEKNLKIIKKIDEELFDILIDFQDEKKIKNKLKHKHNNNGNLNFLKNYNIYKNAKDDTNDLNNINDNINVSVLDTKKDSLKSIKINNITIHSTYDPINESKKIISSYLSALVFKPESFLIFGLGCGYHVREMIKTINNFNYGDSADKDNTNGLNTLNNNLNNNLNNDVDNINVNNIINKTIINKIKEFDKKQIYIIEPSIESLNAILNNCDLSDILDYIKIFVFGYNINEEDIEEKANISSLNTGFFSLTGYQKAFPELYNFIFKIYNIKQLFNTSDFKITIVQPIYGGSSTIGNYTFKAFFELGYKVNILDFSNFFDAYNSFDRFTSNKEHLKLIRDHFVNVLGESIIAKLQDDPPDLVFFMAQSPVDIIILNKIREMNIKTAYWFVEDFRLMTYWKEIALYTDYFFIIQKDDFFKELKAINCDNFYYIPLACLPAVHRKFNVSEINEKDKDYYGSDVSFAGAGYYNRRNAFLKLTDYNFKIWGREWDMNSPISKYIQNQNKGFTEEEAVKIYNYSKINVNLHSSAYHWDINPDGDFLNPRVYEILGCGGFQIVDHRKYMNGEFESGKDFIIFESIPDLREKINYYLKDENENERLEIASHGYETVRKFHTYEKRISKMMNIILSNSYDFYKSKFVNRKENVNNVLNSVKENSELYYIISEMANNGLINNDAITLDDIVSYIKCGSGRLSKTEAMILMLQQIKFKSDS